LPAETAPSQPSKTWSSTVAAYIIVDVEITERVGYEDYKRQTPISVAQYGGRFIVRGGHAENLEGDWIPNRIVVVEFPTLEQAKKWWSSPEYAPVKALRQRFGRTRMIVVEGVN
jgi:uncharacterized protein (DUF1330 family)